MVDQPANGVVDEISPPAARPLVKAHRMPQGRVVITLLFRLLYNLLLFPVAWLFWRIRTTLALRGPAPVKLELTHVPEPGGSHLPFVRRRTLEELANRLDALGRHPKITGLFVELEGLSATAVEAAELRALFDAVKASGKRLHIHLEQPDTPSLLAAAGADRLTTSPSGTVMVRGVGVEIPFLGEMLNRHGVAIQMVRRREYKGAMEPFARATPTVPLVESLQGLVDSVFDGLARLLARPGWSIERSRELLERGPYTMGRALDLGIVDAAEQRDEAEHALAGDGAPPDTRRARKARRRHSPQRSPDKGAIPPPPLRNLMPLDGVGLLPPRPFAIRREPIIAFVPVSGLILDRPLGGMGQRSAVASDLAPRIRRLADARRVEAIVLVIDSRGGTVTGSDRIWNAARYAVGRKPIIAWMRNYAASGGYYVAAAAQSIVASPFTITGSIGVLAWKPNLAEACERLGVNPVLVTRGGGAHLFSPFRPFDHGELEWLDAEVEESYERFKAVVAEGRRIAIEQVEDVAGGRVWTGPQAHERGLVDRIGHFPDVVRLARALAAIPEEKRHIVAWETPPTSPLQMIRRLASQAAMPGPATALFESLLEPWMVAQQSPVLYYLPPVWLNSEPRPGEPGV
jgi:protease IV